MTAFADGLADVKGLAIPTILQNEPAVSHRG
jgi:hypothetical protein